MDTVMRRFMPRCSWRMLVSMVLVAPTFATKPPTLPIFMDPGFQFAELDSIYILPSIDLRTEKAKSSSSELASMDSYARFWLENKGYKIAPEWPKRRSQMKNWTPPSRPEFLEEDLKEPTPAWISKLGPDDARWVLIVALEDAASKITFGSKGSAVVSGYLFDKKDGKCVWKDRGFGKSSSGGLIGMAMKSGMTDDAIRIATADLYGHFEKRNKKKK